MSRPVLDAEAIGELALALAELVKQHYIARPIARERVFEVLNALAVVTSSVLAGCDENARKFFLIALDEFRDAPPL